MKTTKVWFKHDTNSLADDKIFALVLKYGAEGYGVFWAIVEGLYENEGVALSDITLKRIARDLSVDHDKLIEIADYAASEECGHLFTKTDYGYVSHRVCVQCKAQAEKCRQNAENIRKRYVQKSVPVEYESNTNGIPVEYDSGTTGIQSKSKSKSKSKSNNNNVVSKSNDLSTTCGEAKISLPADGEKCGDSEPIFLEFPTLKGGTYAITESQVAEWEQAFPAVDVKQEVRAAKTWLLANPKQMKSNIPRYLVNWLTRTQDRARPSNNEVRSTIKGTDVPMTFRPSSLNGDEFDKNVTFDDLFNAQQGVKKA